jgi:hypothetical protein
MPINSQTGVATTVANASSTTVTIFATITNGDCGRVTLPKTVQLVASAAPIGSFNVTGQAAVCKGYGYTYTANVPGGYQSGQIYSWTYPSGWTSNGLAGNSINLYVPSANTTYGGVNVTVSNGCGSSASSGITVYPSGSCSQSAMTYSYYPNPASTELIVQVSDSTSTDTTPTLETYQLKLYNNFSQPVYSTRSSNKEVKIPLEGIPNGVYYLHLYYKDAVLRKQIVIKK